MQTIYLDISNKGVTPTIYAKQGDVGRKFQAVITDGGVGYAIPEDAQISVWYDGASGEGNYTHINGVNACTADGNTVTVELATQIFKKPGEMNICLIIVDGTGLKIGLWNIHCIVEYIPGVDSTLNEDVESVTSWGSTVLYVEQNLIAAQQKQARKNINAQIYGMVAEGNRTNSATTDEEIDAILMDHITSESFEPKTVRHIVVNCGADTTFGGSNWLFELFKSSANYGYVIARSYYGDGTKVREYRRTWFGGALKPWVDTTHVALTLGNLGIYAKAQELNYVTGVTGNIQYQLNQKMPKFTVLPIANGGTGSIDAEQARLHLHAAVYGLVAPANRLNAVDTDEGIDAVLLDHLTSEIFENKTLRYIFIAVSGETSLGQGEWLFELYKNTSQNGYIIAKTFSEDGAAVKEKRRTWIGGVLQPWIQDAGAAVTDEHINSLIDAKLGVIKNGTC